MPIGVFPYRETFLDFRDYLPSAIQSGVASSKTASEMARTGDAVLTNVVAVPSIGWTLQSYQLHPGDAAWYSDAQAGWFSPTYGNATMAPNHVEFNTFAKQSITGVTYDSGVQSAGSPMIVARPAAATDWTGNAMTADQAAFSGPLPGEDAVPLDRRFRTNDAALDPQDWLIFQFWAPASTIQPRSALACFYFNGPAVSDKAGQADATKLGTGRYALKVMGDGRAYLYELLANNTTWKPRFSFMWNHAAAPITGESVTIAVGKRMWTDAAGHYYGDRLVFNTSNTSYYPGSANVAENLLGFLTQYVKEKNNPYVSTYYVPRLTNQPLTICPVRIDVARDCRASFYVMRHVYKASGSILDDYSTLDQPITTDQLITVTWAGILPSGCGWDVKVYDQNGTLLTVAGYEGDSVTSLGTSSFKQFTPTQYMTRYRVEYDLTASSDKFRAPVLTRRQVFRSPVYQTAGPSLVYTIPVRNAPPARAKQIIKAVDITPQETEAGAENATIVVEDFTGDLDFLEFINMIPVHLWTKYDVTGNPASLFRGYALKAVGRRRRGDGLKAYPAQDWTEWTLECVGEWARATEGIISDREIFMEAFPSPTAPFATKKVTDVVRDQLSNLYPSSMVYVPDSDIRLFGTDSSSWIGEPGTRRTDLVTELASDFFGGYYIFDEAAYTKGAMRMMLQKSAPYNNLAIFEIDHPTKLAGDGHLRLPQWCAAYGTSVVSGQTIQHGFIQAGTLQTYTEKAEGNNVVVFGGGVGQDASNAGGSDAILLQQMAFNVGSFNFLNLAPTDPNYPDGSSREYYQRSVPIRVFDYKLPNQQAVDWKCRRVYDKTCFARYFMAFTGPMMLVTDVTDPIQVRPRRLRFYDAVQVRQSDGSLAQFLVVCCAPSYRHDGVQMARYLLMSQENINTIGVIPTQSSTLQKLRKSFSRTHGVDISHAPMTFSSQKQGIHVAGPTMGLPSTLGAPIQILDPTSGNFGKFYFMPGFSITGGGDIIR